MAATVVSWAEATGMGAPATGAAPVPASTGKVVPWAEAVGLDPLVESVKRSQQPGQVAMDVAKDVGGYTLGVFGAIGDMFAGTYGAVSSGVSHVAGRMGAQIAEPGISQKLAAQAGAIQAEKTPEWLMAPIRTAINSLSPKAAEYYDNSGLSRAFELLTEGVEKGTSYAEEKTGIPAEDYKAAFNLLMGGLGHLGNKAAAAKIKSRIETMAEESAAKKAEDALKAKAAAAPPDTSVPYDTKAKVEPVDLATRKTQLDEQIKAANQERQAAASKVREAAKYQKLAEKETDPALKEALQKRADLATEELHATLTKQAEVKAEQAAAVEAEQQARLGGTTYEVGKAAAPERLSPGDANRIMQASEIQEVLQTPGHLRSAEQLIKLRGALRRSKEAGFISDPELKKALGLFGIISGVGAVAVEGWRSMDPESLAAVREWMHQLVGMGTPEYNMRYPEAPGTQDWMPEWPRGDDAQQPRLFVTDKELGPGLASAALLAGAIRVKRGMWHPEAVTILSKDLKGALIGDAERAQNATRYRLIDKIKREPTDAEFAAAYAETPEGKKDAWTVKTIRNYLNKYAGTEGDPLKDVEIPFGEGVRNWEEVTDQAFGFRAAGDYGKKVKAQGRAGNQPAIPGLNKLLDEGKVSPEEPIYSVASNNFPEQAGHTGTEVGASSKALESYLYHVSDYLRQNVDPAKLSQYDLVRAVKETAANDARVAKEMEKAAAASMKDIPVYKDFGDGMKWVELKLPEKLTPEQAKGVVKVDSVRGKGEPDYVAVDSKGKPIKNSYTQEDARGRTPEEAYLAGKLAEEGNAMGHCVGGYCADVASGDTRILSLRDAKGRSHVTVEVAPKGIDRGLGGTGEQDIVQIKGKQNRAPNKAYLPYVRDLLEEGKWGDVGDLHLTGLTDLSTATYKPFKDLAEELYPGKRYLTEAEIEKVQEEAKTRDQKAYDQRGSADPKQLGMIAGAGAGVLAGAALDEDNRIRGALLGAGAVFTLGALRSGKGLDYTFGALSTQLGNISDALKLRGRNYERGVMEKTARVLDAVHPFLNILKKVEAGSELDLALSNGDGNVIQRVLSTIPGGVDAYNRMQVVLKDFESKHQALGRFKQGLTNYFPRIVTDVEGLLKAIGQEQRTSLEEALTVAEAKMIKERARGLTDVERSLIIDQSMQARPAGSQLPGYARERGVKVVTPELRPFYASPTDSLLRYLSASVQDIELANFFGKDIKTRKVGGKVLTDVEGSIGEIVNREIKAKRVTYEQADNLRKLLKSRFEGGEQTMAEALQHIRNLTNVALLGQFGSAATQLGDSVMTIYHHGLMPTLKAVKEKLTGNAEVSVKDFGLVNHVAEELASSNVTGKALQWVFKKNGFSLLDEFAKGLNLNAGLIKNRGLAATEKGRAQLAQKYATAFGEEFPQLVQDLREGKITENVKSLLFSELSDAQPISKMEMSPAYLDNPNGRILFQMRTYMLKQMDIIRRDGYQEIAKGNYVRGAKNLVGLASAMALSNIPGDVIKEWMSDRDFKLDKIDYVEALLKNFGINRYTLDKLGEGKLKETAVGMVTPAAASLIDLLKMDKRTVKAIPGVGKIIYDRYLGGNEAIKDIEYKRERRIERDRIESQYPSIREERLRKQEEKTQKKLETIRNR